MTLCRSPRPWPQTWRALALVLLPWMLGCESDSFKPEPKDNDPELFTQLELNHHAVTLSTIEPYETLQLVATPRNYEGTSLPGLPAPHYISRDREKVAVTSEGLVVAVAPTSQSVWVVATITTANLKHSDSVLVKVVALDPPPVLATFSVHPLPPDSAKLGTTFYQPGGGTFDRPLDTLPVRATDPSEVPFQTLIPGGIPVSFRSSDPTIARVHRTTGVVIGLRPGSVTIFATTTAFGVKKDDALPYRVGFPVNVNIGVGDESGLGPWLPGHFEYPEFLVGTGANVTWYLPLVSFVAFGIPSTPMPVLEVDVTFSEADFPNIAVYNPAVTGGIYCGPTPIIQNYTLFSDCDNSGNIVLGGGFLVINAAPQPVLAAGRSFLVPGTYEYRSTIHGSGGRIVVIDEQE